MMQAPKFWDRSSTSLLPALLAPLAALYSAVARARYNRTQPWKLPIPVLCIGNLGKSVV